MAFSILLRLDSARVRSRSFGEKQAAPEWYQMKSEAGKVLEDHSRRTSTSLHHGLLMREQFATGPYKLRCGLVYVLPSDSELFVNPILSTTQCGHPDTAHSASLEVKRSLEIL